MFYMKKITKIKKMLFVSDPTQGEPLTDVCKFCLFFILTDQFLSNADDSKTRHLKN